MNYFGASVNQSPVIAEKAGGAITDGAFCTVKFDAQGDVMLCSVQGEEVLGILLPETSKNTQKGDDVTVQLSGIGMIMTGDAIKKGDLIMTDSKGKAVPATDGKFILGVALESSAQAEEIIRVQLTKSGYKPKA